MKLLPLIVFCLALMPAIAQASTSCMKRSQSLYAALNAHDYVAARRHFDDRVRTIVTVDRLKAVWERALPARFGAHDVSAAGQTPHALSAMTIVTPVRFARGWLHMRVTCDAHGTITGFRFLPGKSYVHDQVDSKPKPATGAWGHSLLTRVSSPWGPLPALLTLPKGKGPFPVVVMVAGSGPHDLDERIGPNRPFRDMARGLAAHGIASLRYDKRTYAYPVRSEKDDRLGIDDEVTDDALAAIHGLAGDPRLDPHRVFVLGHSLGAMMAPRIARRDGSLAGLVLLAAPARSLLDMIAAQTRELGPGQGMSPAQVRAAEAANRAERERLVRADPQHPPSGRYLDVQQSYWMSLQGYDQVRVAKSLHLPMLFLQGSSDFQVSPSIDYGTWKKVFTGDSRVSFREYPGLSHLFMPAGKTRTVKDYMKPAHVEPKVIDDIARWIGKQPPRRR